MSLEIKIKKFRHFDKVCRPLYKIKTILEEIQIQNKKINQEATQERGHDSLTLLLQQHQDRRASPEEEDNTVVMMITATAYIAPSSVQPFGISRPHWKKSCPGLHIKYTNTIEN